MTTPPLKNRTIVVTRPTGQAGQLMELLKETGATALHFPVIDIQPPTNETSLQEQAKELVNYELAIFISRNAVIYGSKFLPPIKWPKNTAIAAIGRGTALQLKNLGYAIDHISTTTANSEGLLAEPALNTVKNKHILIIRGDGGREKLAETLSSRGARVDYFECYKRSLPQIDTSKLYALWDNGTIDGIVITSSEGLRNLYHMVQKPYQQRLNNTPLFVISSKMVELCAKLGYKLKPVLMTSAHDDEVVKSVIKHCANFSGTL